MEQTSTRTHTTTLTTSREPDRDFIRTLRKENPDATQDELRETFIWYWVEQLKPGIDDNRIRAFRLFLADAFTRKYGFMYRKEQKRDERQEALKESIREDLQTGFHKVVKMEAIKLSYVMPNGRTLAECTFRQAEDMLTHMGAFGLWLREQGRPRQKIGSVLDDAQIEAGVRQALKAF